MRFDPISREERVLREATRRSRTPGSAAPFSGGARGVSVAPPGSTTTPVEDVDGQILDAHAMFWGMDDWGDITSLWG